MTMSLRLFKSSIHNHFWFHLVMSWNNFTDDLRWRYLNYLCTTTFPTAYVSDHHLTNPYILTVLLQLSVWDKNNAVYFLVTCNQLKYPNKVFLVIEPSISITQWPPHFHFSFCFSYHDVSFSSGRRSWRCRLYQPAWWSPGPEVEIFSVPAWLLYQDSTNLSGQLHHLLVVAVALHAELLRHPAHLLRYLLLHQVHTHRDQGHP